MAKRQRHSSSSDAWAEREERLDDVKHPLLMVGAMGLLAFALGCSSEGIDGKSAESVEAP